MSPSANESHNNLRAMFFSSKFLCFLFITAIAILISSSQYNKNNNNDKVYPSSNSIEQSLSVPILSILNDCLKFIRLYLNDSSISLISINNINVESFGEDTYRQQTVYLRSYYSNEPIQAVHNELIHIFFLNITNIDLLLSNNINHDFTLNIDLAQTAQNRWAPISFISSSHLPIIPSIEIGIESNTNKLRIMTMNLWNFNYWLKRLNLINRILFEYEPDIIGLQEVRIRSKYWNELYPYEDPYLLHTFQIYDLISELSYFQSSRSKYQYQWYSSPAMFFKESTPEQYPEHIVGEGLGIISKYPIIYKHKLELSRDTNDGLDFHQRLLLGITVQINDRDDYDDNYKLIDIYTTHLSLSESARNRTLPEIGNYINNALNVTTHKHNKIGAVLMGDFNCEFDYMGYDILSQSEYNLLDVWKSTGKCKDDDQNQKENESSFNYAHNGNDDVLAWNHDTDSLFESPNSDYLSRHVIKPILSDNFDFDFDSFNRFVYRNMKNDEWWRDNRCKNGWTFNSWDMKKRIDYFYVNKDFIKNIKDIKVVGDDIYETVNNLDPVGGVSDMKNKLYASDHRFLYIDIEY